MASYTLLQITQAMLNAADEDSVNDINDTEASESAILVAKEVYYDLIHSEDWSFLMKATSLTGLSDVTQPTVLQMPDNMTLLDHQELFQYDVTLVTDTYSKYRDIEYMAPGDFMRMLRARNDSNSNVTKYTGYESLDLLIITDEMPHYWTSFDDKYIVMDSYHSATESTLQGQKCTVQAKEIPTWSATNSAVPTLPDNMFPNYLARCKAKFNSYFTQKENPLDLLEAQSGKSRQRRKGNRSAGRHKRPNYGRNRSSSRL